MFWAPVLSDALSPSLLPGSHSQPVLTQPPSASVSLGNTVRLSCAFSSGVSVSNYYVNWFQQKPGSPPRFLLWYYSDSSKGQGSGVPTRFSGSKDTSTNSGILTISGVLAEDEADYYCAAAHGSGSSWQLAQ
uniref:Ig-like domain-containing protein n=1 Tax=Varanus komodoensis TaxID=61221 RepID=A0A8D2JJV6_VARKO